MFFPHVVVYKQSRKGRVRAVPVAREFQKIMLRAFVIQCLFCSGCGEEDAPLKKEISTEAAGGASDGSPTPEPILPMFSSRMRQNSVEIRTMFNSGLQRDPAHVKLVDNKKNRARDKMIKLESGGQTLVFTDDPGAAGNRRFSAGGKSPVMITKDLKTLSKVREATGPNSNPTFSMENFLSKNKRIRRQLAFSLEFEDGDCLDIICSEESLYSFLIQGFKTYIIIEY
mmetsp:Transcript_8470/g.13004  ORF Transcript_8470/g.13004 Transcript_8470/m.13004 type:complete len:227 (+) Transcript_8470:110-790(+)